MYFRERREAENFYAEAAQELRRTYQLELNLKKSGIVETEKQRFLGYTFRR